MWRGWLPTHVVPGLSSPDAGQMWLRDRPKPSLGGCSGRCGGTRAWDRCGTAAWWMRLCWLVAAGQGVSLTLLSVPSVLVKY